MVAKRAVVRPTLAVSGRGERRRTSGQLDCVVGPPTEVQIQPFLLAARTSPAKSLAGRNVAYWPQTHRPRILPVFFPMM